MIQLKRGTTSKWRDLKVPLAAGQPGYDKNKHKLKVGDGTTNWKELPYTSGLRADEILDSEERAKRKINPNIIVDAILGLFGDPEDTTLITYGTENPDDNTVGQLYLQYYDAEPEADYVVEYGTTGIWTYQKWHSGIARCWGSVSINTKLKENFEKISLCSDSNSMQPIDYPFSFKYKPNEVASLTSPNIVSWLAGRSSNSTTQTGTYNIISVDETTDNAIYNIALNVEGFWR